MDELRVCLVQADLIWEDRTQNLALLYELVSKSEPADIYILPEMFATGFTMQAAKYAESDSGESVLWMKSLAREKNAAITGSLVIKEGENYFNRLFWVEPSGQSHIYNKRHLFSLAGEEKVYTPGTQQLIIEYKNWRIMPQVCYDLRFPVWSRNTMNYDMLFYVANWPERRIYHWKQLLLARAIENQAYVIGVNRVGNDGNNIWHSGDSVAINTMGEVLSSVPENKQATAVVTLTKSALQETRNRFGFLKDRDTFEIKDAPGPL